MKLITDIDKALWNLFPEKYQNVLYYIEKWHHQEVNKWDVNIVIV